LPGATREPKTACGTCGPVPAEACNGVDDDCNGFIDEGGVCGGCVPQPEVCNGLDDNCNGTVDEGLTRPCGSSVGVCTPGTQTCTGAPGGVWSTCTGMTPTTEVCNGLDDDCDGVVDGETQNCGFPDVGVCMHGTQVCMMGTFG